MVLKDISGPASVPDLQYEKIILHSENTTNLDFRMKSIPILGLFSVVGNICVSNLNSKSFPWCLKEYLAVKASANKD